MHVSKLFSAVAAATLFSAPSFGALIVDFNSSQADAGATILALDGTTSTAGGNLTSILAFGDNAGNGLTVTGFPKLTVSSSYYAAGATGAGLRTLAYRTQDTPDRLQFLIQPANTGGAANTVAEFDLLMLVYKQDFAAHSTEQVQFDANSSMRVTKTSLPAGVNFNFVIKDGSEFYMSDRRFTSVDAGPLVLSNLPDQTWVTFDPTNGGDGNIRSLTSASTGGQSYSFNDIQAVGLYWEGATTTTAARTIATNSWTVEASPVPEPGFVALLGGALAFGALGRRKHA